MFMTVKQAVEKWHISGRRVRVLCSEGITLRETDLILRGLTIAQKPLKDHMEAVGHKEAFDFVRELVSENVPITTHLMHIM